MKGGGALGRGGGLENYSRFRMEFDEKQEEEYQVADLFQRSYQKHFLQKGECFIAKKTKNVNLISFTEETSCKLKLSQQIQYFEQNENYVEQEEEESYSTPDFIRL